MRMIDNQGPSRWPDSEMNERLSYYYIGTSYIGCMLMAASGVSNESTTTNFVLVSITPGPAISAKLGSTASGKAMLKGATILVLPHHNHDSGAVLG